MIHLDDVVIFIYEFRVLFSCASIKSKVFFPFAVLAVLCLFLYADLSLGTSVDLNIAAGGHDMTFGSLFSFSLIGTIGSTWNAGA